MQREMPVELLRWICVLPAAVMGGIAARYLGSIVGRFAIYGSGSESNFAFSIQLLAYAIAAAAFVLAGAFTAPRNRRTTALVLAIAATLLSLLSHVLSQRHPGTVNYLHVAAETAGAALAIAYLFYGKLARGRDDEPRDDKELKKRPRG